MGHALISPLNWGLGHSTRDIPLIKELLRNGHEVTVATSGNALVLLKKECPECNFILYKDYPTPYSSTRFFLPKFVASIPILLKAMLDERKRLTQILSKDKYDVIISDNRMGVYSDKVPSYFITHQLRFSLPDYLKPFEVGTLYVNAFFHARYTGVIVPDVKPNGSGNNLSGKLANSNIKLTNDKAYYAGILTSTEKKKVDQDLDFLIIVSGPEPQRTKLEEIILKQVRKLPGEKVVLLGSPQREAHQKLDEHTTVHSYVSTEEKVELMNRARFLISRSGYTTMMELAELDKKHGLFTPTPGQTEQEYLSRYYARQGWFLSRSQYKLRFPDDVDAAMRFKGFPEMPKTEENVRRLYREVLKRHLT
jgi:UDP:flavonoid glycosyltransferase YjiC (YdhE family)